ncbi:MAG: F0F1 ATP synthase subunit epsilon [Candidatus Riflebacteria bacterium]|nr:F0F1 ATP synthase subunit epsilon [Candidatus Riflebacteria bacterium]
MIEAESNTGKNATFELTIAAPSHRSIVCTARSVMVPGVNGYFGVMRGHAPIIANLNVGLLKVVDNLYNETWMSVTGGFFEMMGDHATLLADKLYEKSDLVEYKSLIQTVTPAFMRREFRNESDKDILAITLLSGKKH